MGFHNRRVPHPSRFCSGGGVRVPHPSRLCSGGVVHNSFLYQGTTNGRIEDTQLGESSIAQIATIATIGRFAAQNRTNRGDDWLHHRTDFRGSPPPPITHKLELSSRAQRRGAPSPGAPSELVRRGGRWGRRSEGSAVAFRTPHTHTPHTQTSGMPTFRPLRRTGNRLSREVRRKLLATVLLEFPEEAWAIRQLARMHDLGAISPGDRNRPALLACIDLDYVRPPNSFVFPCPECLPQSFGIYEDGPWERREEPDGDQHKANGGRDGEQMAAHVSELGRNQIDKESSQNQPRSGRPAVRGKFNASAC
jgi:hypothetical protein